VEWPADFKREPRQQVMAIMSTPFPHPPADMLTNREALMAWQRSPEIQELVAKARHVQLREGDDGVWAGEDVRPGNYTIAFSVIQPPENPGPVQQILPLLSGQKPVTIPDGSDEAIDLGVITLAPQTPTAN